MKLLNLTLRNFKGIKHLTINADGQNLNIYGANETGKTTIVDAFMWLLFNKDSSNRTNFSIKTLDKNNNVIHGLDHEVEAVLEVNGKTINLRKLYHEVWTKRKGSTESVLTNHESLYWIDDVPKLAKEYNEFVSSMVDEKIFKLITNPLFFNEQISWQDRRNILVGMCENVNKQDIIAVKGELSEILGLLEEKETDDIRKMLAERKKKLNDDLKAIPVRIDELSRSMPVLDGDIDYDDIENNKQKCKDAISKLESSLTDLAQKQQEKEKQLNYAFGLKTKIADIERKITSSRTGEISALENKLSILVNRKESLTSDVKFMEKTIEEQSSLLGLNEEHLNDLRTQWDIEEAKVFVEPDRSSFKCTTCGQDLPTDDIDAKIAEMKQSFESNKHRVLDELTFKGKSLKLKGEECNKTIESCKERLVLCREKILTTIAEIDSLEKLIEQQKSMEAPDYTTDKEWIALNKELEKTEKSLSDEDAQEKITETRNKIRSLNDEIEECNSILNDKENIKKFNARIKELQDKERDLAEQYSVLEKQSYLIEEYIKTEANLLEEKINSIFKYVKFKMFNIQVNGGIDPTCEALVNGVPFSDTNNAAKINAGLDIINALTDYYGVAAPIFVDNAESVNEILATKGQQIKLYVSADAVLRIESEVE